MLAREWYLLAATYDAATETAEVHQRALEPMPVCDASTSARGRLEASPRHAGLPLLIAASNAEISGTVPGAGHFNGKLERPRISASACRPERFDALLHIETEVASDIVAAWDFSRGIDTELVRDASPAGLDGELINLPTRGVTGYEWTGEHLSWREAPSQYAAIHFHEDDLMDARWAVDFSLTIPRELPSGVYAIRLRDGTSEDHVPFFVRPGPSTQPASIAFLAAAGTYIAYANNHAAYTEALDEMEWGALTEVQLSDIYLSGHYELGLSTYDTHADGSGVPYSSRLRPILTMRPRYRLWNFNADLHVIDWLDRQGFACDVLTDEDLDRVGSELLEPYRVLITGTHPEYCSRAMLDAIDALKHRGGRLMYLGGNGFYWRICFHPDRPGLIECRKSEGVRSWEASPGERYHSFTGAPGGLWRHLGRAPQATAGVGTAAFGFESCGYYLRRADSFDARAAFIFDGIDDDARIGDFGVTGGAVGFEIDRADRALGTPSHCLVVASSAPLSRLYMLSPEEVRFLYPAMSGEDNNQVRADMTFYECPNGGAVFSTGSITWAASLSHNEYRNNVSRITRNVLERFLDPAAFEVGDS